MITMDPYSVPQTPRAFATSLIGSVRAVGLPRIVTTASMREQFRRPRSKKARIRRKWEKAAANWRPMRTAFFDSAGNVVYCHPEFAAKLQIE